MRSLEICVPRAHGFGGLAEARASFRIASSKAIIWAVSNSEPIGSTESLPPRSSAIVWAGITVTTSTSLASPPSGCAVTSAVRAPAARAIPASVRAVGRSPGPAETNKRSPAPTAGAVMSPQTATSRPMWNSRMANPRICRPSRPRPNTTIRFAADDLFDQRVERVVGHGGEHAGKIVQRAFRQLDQAFGHECFLIAPSPKPIRASRSGIRP